MIWSKPSCEVLVVGAGPVGQFVALELARRGVATRIVDEQWRTTSRSYALGLHPRSLELLDAHGLAQPLVELGHPLEGVVFHDRDRELARVDFKDAGGKYPFLLVLPQFALEAALERALEARKIRIEWNHRVDGIRTDGERAVAALQTLGKETMGYATSTTEWVVEKEEEVSPSFVVGADGHRSKVRRAAGIGYPEVAPAQRFAVFEFSADLAPLKEAHVVFDRGTTNVLWSMKGGRFRWGFELKDPAAPEDERKKSRLLVGFDAHAYPAVDPGRLSEFVAERAPWFTAGVREVFWSAAIRFERRLADRFGEGRVWLAGDAAHLASPVGMQSMNVGLREARDLAWSIAEVLRERGTTKSLEAYDRERHREWRALFGLDGAPHVGSSAAPWVREHAADLVSGTPASGSALKSLLKGIGVEAVLEEEWTVPA